MLEVDLVVDVVEHEDGNHVQDELDEELGDELEEHEVILEVDVLQAEDERVEEKPYPRQNSLSTMAHATRRDWAMRVLERNYCCGQNSLSIVTQATCEG